MEFKPLLHQNREVLDADTFYNWRSRAAFPGAGDRFIHFMLPEGMFAKAMELPLSLSLLDCLNQFFPEFLFCAGYFGWRNTCHRISNSLADEGYDPQESWELTACSLHLMAKEMSWVSECLREYEGIVVNSNPAEIVYPLTYLHSWTINQFADIYLKDFHARGVKNGGLPFALPEQVAARARQILEAFPAGSAAGNSLLLPYACIAPVQR